MRKPLVLLAIVVSAMSVPAFAQATSGGQTPQPGGNMGNSELNPYNSSNVTSQYLRQKSLNNLPSQTASDASASKLGAARAAKAEELTAGATVNDKTGVAIA